MNQEKIDKINETVRTRRAKGPLFFCTYISPRYAYGWRNGKHERIDTMREESFDIYRDELTFTRETLQDLIKHILSLKRTYSSCRWSKRSKKYIYETSDGRSRSSYDIWRHCLNYISDLTLPEVMEEIYNTRGICSHYCHTVRRRVFNIHWNSQQRSLVDPTADEYKLKGEWF